MGGAQGWRKSMRDIPGGRRRRLRRRHGLGHGREEGDLACSGGTAEGCAQMSGGRTRAARRCPGDVRGLRADVRGPAGGCAQMYGGPPGLRADVRGPAGGCAQMYGGSPGASRGCTGARRGLRGDARGVETGLRAPRVPFWSPQVDVEKLRPRPPWSHGPRSRPVRRGGRVPRRVTSACRATSGLLVQGGGAPRGPRGGRGTCASTPEGLPWGP